MPPIYTLPASIGWFFAVSSISSLIPRSLTERVYMGGKLVNSYLNQEETSNRIYQIDQKSSLINNLSITDNLFVMRPGFKKQVINEWVLREQADRVLKQLSMDLDLNKRVERLTTMERIMVEIAKAYLMGSKLLVVLYPEKLIGQADFPQFHQLLRKMQSMGISTLYFCYHHWIIMIRWLSVTVTLISR